MSEPSQTPPPDSTRSGPRARPASFFDRRAWGEATTAFLLGCLAMAWIHSASPSPIGNDDHYHIKMAEIWPTIGFSRQFPWLQWTIFRDRFVSHHYGFHIVLSPFVLAARHFVGDPVRGAKIACALAAGFSTLGAWWVLRIIGTRRPLLWLGVLGLAPWHFWMRLAYIRAPMAGLPLLLAGLVCVLRGRTWLVGLVAFLFTQIYGGGVIFPLVPLAFVLAALLTGQEVGLALRQTLVAVGGVGLALVVSPYFPQNFAFLHTQIFRTGFGGADDIGGEWRAFDTWTLARMAGGLAAVWLAALCMRLRSGITLSRAGLGLTLLSLAFLAMTLRSRRFVEYWPPFALFSAAALATVPARAWLPPLAFKWSRLVSFQRGVLTFAVVALLGCAGLTLRQTHRSARPRGDLADIRRAMEWLVAHSPPRSMVFTDDWDIFPYCFYFNTHNTYAVGLDPEFSRALDPRMWERYKIITRGQAPGRIGDEKVLVSDIATRFGAQYVLVQRNHPDLYRQLNQQKEWFERVYPRVVPRERQPAMSVFRVREQVQTQPASGPESAPPSGPALNSSES